MSFLRKILKKKKSVKTGEDRSGQAAFIPKDYFGNNLDENVKKIIETLGNSSDIIIRKMEIGRTGRIAIIYTDGLADDKLIDNNIIGELITKESMDETISEQHSLHIIKEKLISISGVKSIYDWDQLFHSLLSGETIILMDNANEALSISTVGGEKEH